MYQDIIILAQDVEKWAIKLRYKDNKINENIPLIKIFYLNQISTESVIMSDALGQIKEFLFDLEKFEEIPEEIKNRLLILKAFYVEPLKIEFPQATQPITKLNQQININ